MSDVASSWRAFEVEAPVVLFLISAWGTSPLPARVPVFLAVEASSEAEHLHVHVVPQGAERDRSGGIRFVRFNMDFPTSYRNRAFSWTVETGRVPIPLEGVDLRFRLPRHVRPAVGSETVVTLTVQVSAQRAEGRSEDFFLDVGPFTPTDLPTVVVVEEGMQVPTFECTYDGTFDVIHGLHVGDCVPLPFALRAMKKAVDYGESHAMFDFEPAVVADDDRLSRVGRTLSWDALRLLLADQVGHYDVVSVEHWRTHSVLGIVPAGTRHRKRASAGTLRVEASEHEPDLRPGDRIHVMAAEWPDGGLAISARHLAVFRDGAVLDGFGCPYGARYTGEFCAGLGAPLTEKGYAERMKAAVAELAKPG